jgi:hypothetical protein
VLCVGYVHLLKEEVTRSLACVATKQRERCMKWFTPSNQTLQTLFPLLCKTVYRRQPNKMPKVVSASHDAILAPKRLPPGSQKIGAGYQSRPMTLELKKTIVVKKLRVISFYSGTCLPRLDRHELRSD